MPHSFKKHFKRVGVLRKDPNPVALRTMKHPSGLRVPIHFNSNSSQIKKATQSKKLRIDFKDEIQLGHT